MNNSFIEKPNFEIVKKLSYLNESQINILLKASKTKRNKGYKAKEEHTKIKKFYEQLKKENGEINQTYEQIDNLGRKQAKKPSIQRIFNGFRGLMCDGLFVDLDISACHNHIFLNLCKKYNLPIDTLNEYILNREDKLNEIMNNYKVDRCTAKDSFLRVLNKYESTDTIGNKKLKKNCFLKKYDECTSYCINELYEIYKKNDKYKDKLKIIKSDPKNKNQYNIKGKFVNCILQDTENEILEEGIKFVQNLGLEVGVLMYDGMMVYKKNDFDFDSLLSLINSHFENKGGYKWTIKNHAVDLMELLLNMETKDYYLGTDIIDIVKHILDVPLNNKIVRCQGQLFYMNDEIINGNEKDIKHDLYNFVSEQEYSIITEDSKGNEKIIQLSKKHTEIKNIVESIISKCPKQKNFLKEVWNYTQFKLFFKNGYYDFKLNQFIQGSYNKTFIKIDKNYKVSNNKEIRNLIYEKIFNPIFTIIEDDNKKERNELLEYFLFTVSNFLAGNINIKRWILLEGFRNSGKGIIADLLKNCFENYILSTNASNFNFKSGSQDSQKALSWLIDYQFVRIAVTSEIPTDQPVDGNMIKKFTSGGDYMSARKNYADEMEFRIQSGLLVCCNMIPEIDPSDALEFCDEFQMKSKFITKDFKEEDKFKGFSYYEKDDNLKSDFLTRPEIINELINIFIEYYFKSCSYPKKILEEVKSNDNNEYELMKDNFKIVDDPECTLTNKQLKYKLKELELNFTLKKLKQLLKSQGAFDYRSASSRGLSNIKLVDEDSDDEDSEDKNSLDSGVHL